VKKESNSVVIQKGLLFKISGISSALLIVAIVILAIINVRSIQVSSLQTAVIMGKSKLTGDLASFEDKLAEQYGQISLGNGDLVDEKGNSLVKDYRLVDLMSSRLGVQATIFMRENQDYRRISTSIVDSTGKRAVDTFLGSGSAAYKPIQSGNEYIGNAVILGKNYLSAYKPLFANNTHDVIGILFIGIEMSSIQDTINRERSSDIISVIIEAVIILLIATLVNVASCRIILLKPIRVVIDVLKHLGEGDLTKQSPVRSKDEIGVMTNYINAAIGKIRDLVITINQDAVSLAGIGNDLAGNMNESASAVGEINANIQGIKGRILNQSASVNETNKTMEQLAANINKLDRHIENQSSDISRASTAIEEMVANIQSVTATLVKNAGNVETLRESSGVGHTGLSQIAADIEEIAKESEGLLEINLVMKNIASQTNLLSMNAAIEAAHAGEAGRGFAVVADEIRKLAENSGEQSKTIGTVLKKMKEAIDKISRSTGNVLDKFEAIDSSVATVAEQEENIRHAMEEQGSGSRQLLDGVSNVNEITRQVKNSSHEMLEAANEVIQESANLGQVTQEVSSGMNAMALGAGQINTSINHVSEISEKNREGIKTLIKEVARFKVE